jgi:hypothetical protein
MSKRTWVFLVAAFLLLAIFQESDQASAQDGSVRFLTAGPVRLGDGHTAHMRVFLPAVQRPVQHPVHVHFLGEGGVRLTTVEVKPPAGSGPFFEVFLEVTLDESSARGTITITDASGTVVHAGPSNGTIAMVIGPQRTGGMGTLQIFDAGRQSVGILPYIEQDNLFRP